MIDEMREVNAAEKMINVGLSTIEDKTVELSDGDFMNNHRQNSKEHTLRKDADLLPSKAGA